LNFFCPKFEKNVARGKQFSITIDDASYYLFCYTSEPKQNISTKII